MAPGLKTIGGVTPRRKDLEVHGVQVFDTVEPLRSRTDAVFEAIENGVKLIVIVAEHIPRGDVAQMVELAARGWPA
jgi:succinyl-CoA synthetase alpha subunit